MDEILADLDDAAISIFNAVRKGLGLKLAESENESGDDQIELDIFADLEFRKRLSLNSNVRYVLSEEQPDLVQYSDGQFSVALDPLDGSKSALVGIPSGAIFGIFENAQKVQDFAGKKVVAAGFYVFGATLECFRSIGGEVSRRIFQENLGVWEVADVPAEMPSANFFAINVSNYKYWPEWLKLHYDRVVLRASDGTEPSNIRWYASMVSEVKRLILEGGIFAYPENHRTGYERGRLRLVYEAIPMAYVVESLGGRSSTGIQSLLTVEPQELHEKVPVYLGEKKKIEELEGLKD